MTGCGRKTPGLPTNSSSPRKAGTRMKAMAHSLDDAKAWPLRARTCWRAGCLGCWRRVFGLSLGHPWQLASSSEGSLPAAAAGAATRCARSGDGLGAPDGAACAAALKGGSTKARRGARDTEGVHAGGAVRDVQVRAVRQGDLRCERGLPVEQLRSSGLQVNSLQMKILQ